MKCFRFYFSPPLALSQEAALRGATSASSYYILPACAPGPEVYNRLTKIKPYYFRLASVVAIPVNDADKAVAVMSVLSRGKNEKWHLWWRRLHGDRGRARHSSAHRQLSSPSYGDRCAIMFLSHSLCENNQLPREWELSSRVTVTTTAKWWCASKARASRGGSQGPCPAKGVLQCSGARPTLQWICSNAGVFSGMKIPTGPVWWPGRFPGTSTFLPSPVLIFPEHITPTSFWAPASPAASFPTQMSTWTRQCLPSACSFPCGGQLLPPHPQWIRTVLKPQSTAIPRVPLQAKNFLCLQGRRGGIAHRATVLCVADTSQEQWIL